MSDTSKIVLISTIQPVGGGVPQMVRFVIACLLKQGYRVRLAYYQPYSVSPTLSVPLYRLWRAPLVWKQGRVPKVVVTEFEGHLATGVGCWAPELEFTNYWTSSRWQSVIESSDFHLCVSGSNLAALAFLQSEVPFLAWVATPWLEDRLHRVSEFPWYRRCLDYLLVRPVCQYLERRLNRTGNIVALSDYTRDRMNRDETTVKHVLPMPVDTQRFSPVESNNTAIKIGFIGRFEDPRKNIQLLLTAFAACLTTQPTMQLLLIGDTPSAQTKATIQQLGIADNVMIVPYLQNDKLPHWLQQLSLFVIPSHQEGLCIAALEAMSCGVPVVSTYCGGPETYIQQGKNGCLVDANPNALQKAILQIVEDSNLLKQYSRQARQTVLQEFSVVVAEQKFWQLCSEIYPQLSKIKQQ